MKILITGGGGFIGSHCARALAAAGHEVVSGARHVPEKGGPLSGGHMQIDFMRDLDVEVWRGRLAGFDTVINAVGAMADRRDQKLELLHTRAPRALFDACRERNIEVINISALGADEGAASAFHRTKKAADDYLLASHPRAVVLQPSLVYGAGGASARMFDSLASLPFIPLVGDGSQRVQPIHIDDVSAVVTRIVGSACCYGRRIALVGPAPLEMRTYLEQLRMAIGLGRARFIHVPFVMAETAVSLAAHVNASWASPDSLRMLARGNCADPGEVTRLLGRPPRAVSDFVPRELAAPVALSAKWTWLSLLLRWTIAAVWLTAGVVSAGVYPLSDSVALVEATGAGPALSTSLVFLGAGLDIVLGLATLLLRSWPPLWLLQMAVIAGYTIIISWWLPEFWLHPFGPVVKNLPLLAAIYLMYEFERR